VLALALALTTGASGAQADPEEDKRRVERQLDQARHDLDESSAQLLAATKALRATEERLAAARNHLQAVRGQLTAAAARDAALAASLRQAREALAEAKAAVRRSSRRVAEQRERIAAFANASYQISGAAELAAILSSADPGDLLGQVQIVTSVTESQRTALARLDAATATLAGQRAALHQAEREVARQRAEAAANLVRIRALEREASATEKRVRALVEERKAAVAEAARAKAEDLRRYRDLVAERERIRRLLEELARRERERGGDTRDDSNGGSRLLRPVDGPVTSPYGMRFHPILRRWKLHDGADFGASCGTPVRAAASGRVLARYYNSGYGRRVLLAHGRMKGASTVTAYNHLSSYAVGVNEWVERGQVVGYVGTTGYSTGCHLHFMVLRDGRTVDPMNYL
jgi:murein DD-endopeptidase MepM/ murein hydrolase activator NlpD